ncbi:MAG: hypothetical protein M3Z04_24660 [Chloroflexota bacterium]|nr:hypothetical protein [Chloroflexota bacterium]
MGLDAFVRCTCWEQGLITPPPFADHLIVDEDGDLTLDLSYDDHEDLYEQFEEWKQTACDHPDMWYTSERVANWSGYQHLLESLEVADWRHFPTLHSTLPSGNSGSTSPSEAARSLAELAIFRALCDRNRLVELINSESGAVVHSFATPGAILVSGDDLDIGFDEAGLFVAHRAAGSGDATLRALESVLPPVRAALDPSAPPANAITEPSREVFRACRIGQQVLGDDPPPAGEGEVEFTDLDSGRQFRGPLGITEGQIPWPGGAKRNAAGHLRWAYPARLHIEVRTATAADFAYILDPLTSIFEAAVEIGHPVRWC